MIEECAEGGEWSATGFNWRAADGLFSLHGAATKQHTKATTRNLSFSGPLPFTSQKGGDTETKKKKKKKNAKMCRSRRLWVPLFHEAAQWADCVSLGCT